MAFTLARWIRRRRAAVAPAAAFLITLAALAPGLADRPQHRDEAQYGWAAGYYGKLIGDADYRRGSRNDFDDPGWAPFNYWTSLSNQGTYHVYSVALAVSGEDAPARPYNYSEPAQQGRETFLSPSALEALRWAAVLCAALGFALIAWRFGWSGLAAVALLLAIPHVRDDLVRAWAEGPLVLGWGLCAAAWRTRLFAPAVGLATTFKLTALGLWPLLLWRRATGGLGKAASVLLAGLTWALLTPASWLAAGPLYILSAIGMRTSEYAGQSSDGFFVPSRYLIPLELVGFLLLAFAAPLLVRAVVERVRARKRASRGGAGAELPAPAPGTVA